MKNVLDKRIATIEEKINPNSEENKIMAEKLGQLIKEAEKALGREPLPPLDPSRTYTQEELRNYYRRDY